MPVFELEQVDGGSPLELPFGETVLGRGAFLGVNDKRVSRNHAILENQNGSLRLKPTHLNPCFIQTDVLSPPTPLEKNEWHWLKDGDLFSLLPGKYIYRVHLKQDAETLSSSQVFKEECFPGPAGVSEATLEAKSSLASARQTCTAEINTSDLSRNRSSVNEASISSQQDNFDLPQRKRVLPAWMMTSSAKELKGSPKKAKGEVTPKQTPGRARAARISSEEDEMPNRETTSLRRNSEDEAHTPEGVQIDESKSDQSNPQVRQGPSQGLKATKAEKKASTKKVKQQRKPCPYGSSCYRKNPLHFQESSHPGDTDYYETEKNDEDEDDRPECPYGTHCYRKNPLHKKEYKHTESPPRNAAAAVADEDEDQYENSFINDESEEEEVDEDSDYVPESEDSGKEDIKQLQKEAKAFLGRKKR
ncbi:hypothetical protein DNTS_004455 [Danionella cerebrum]|uniref:Aprataxin and PNK-like factor PBZ domain-containing protein n=1 Tax=Danionella cerebrum TaxID=2873325 RepID=A0A553PZD0_9TELE|nr:hypothetical protein DNTS_004455 [Danionella translucida]